MSGTVTAARRLQDRLWLAAAFAIAIAAGMPAAAAAAPQLTVAPLIIEQVVSVDEPVLVPVSVSNSGDTPFTVVFEHADFGFGEDGPVLIEDSAPETVPFGTRGWFSVATPRFELEPGERRSVDVRVLAPVGTGPGTYLGAMLFRTLPDQGSGSGAEVRTSARAGPLAFIEVEGGVPARPVLRSLDAPRLVTASPVPVELVVGNDGDGFYTFTATITATGRGLRRELEVPTSYVIREVDRSNSFRVERDGGGLPIGRIRIRTEVDPGAGRDLIVATATTWYLPQWLLLLMAFAATGTLGTIGWWLWHLRDAKGAGPFVEGEQDHDHGFDGDDLLEDGDGDMPADAPEHDGRDLPHDEHDGAGH